MAIETEIKIKVDDHERLANKLLAAGAGYKGVVFQKDSYFDNSQGDMLSLDSCLRLRSESDEKGSLIRSVLCYKGPKLPGKIKARTEIETVVDKPDNMRQILEAAGYDIALSFNKKREIWLLNDCEVGLDTLPLIGTFIEIEGGTEDKVITAANMLGLDVTSYERKSYACLIDDALKRFHLAVHQIYLEDDVEKLPKDIERESDCDNGFKLVYMIVNPKSGTGFVASMIGRLDDYFRSKGLGVRMNRIGEFADIKRFVELAKNSADCVLIAACGGDGTIREVAHHLRGSDKPLMVIPGGTENLLAHELGCDKNIDTYKRMFEQQSIMPLDLACANGNYFTSVLGVGFDAEIVHLVSKHRTGNITHANYVWPVWRTFWAHDLPRFTVWADGREIFSGRGMLFAGNSPRYASGLRILNNASLSDGELDICIYPCKGRFDILKYLMMAMNGKRKKDDGVIYVKCRDARITSDDERIMTQIDGDPGPSLPLDIKIVPSAVRVFSCSEKS